MHVSEYVWAAAHSFHRPGTPAAEAWAAGHLTTILHRRASRAAAEITAQAEQAGLRGAKREAADTCVRYLAGHLDQLCYDTALAEGRPIATGPIEGACRHLIGDRLEITGARWGLSGAEAVLKLRAVKDNGDLDAYFAFHSPASTNGSIPPLTSTTTTSRSEPQASPGESYTLRRSARRSCGPGPRRPSPARNAQRNLFNRMLGQLYHCLQAGELFAEQTACPTPTAAAC